MTNRTKLFISYSHEDIRWLQAVKEQLAVLEREGLLDVYEDTQLLAGEAWFDRLDAEMTSAKVGLLLISAPFLSSGFIRNEEIPRLFDRHAAGGMIIFPLLVRPCSWQHVGWLSKLQLRPQDTKRRPKAVAAYSGAARDQVLADVASEIARIVTASVSGQVANYASEKTVLQRSTDSPQSEDSRKFKAECIAFSDRRVGGRNLGGEPFLGDNSMNSFDKFLELHQVDARQKVEIAQGFLWYHCRATGQKDADIDTIMAYFKAASVAPTSSQELDREFRSTTHGVTALNNHFRVLQNSAAWFNERYESAVFGSNLPVFAVQRL